jgi:hypothetical protein
MISDITSTLDNAGMDLFESRHDVLIPKAVTASEIANDTHMSSWEKARALGILSDAGHKERGLISWRDVGRAAVGYGVGHVAGNLFGKALGTLYSSGLSTQARHKLQQIGGFAGMLRATGVLKGW